MAKSADPAASLRAEMVAQLWRRGGLSDPRVKAALAEVPRHLFVPGVELSEAYSNRAIATHYRDGVPTSSASQPAIVATMLEQLRPPAGGSVLEIGAGTGYNAALLSRLVGPSGRVVTVDIDAQVANEAHDHLSRAGITNVEVICGDGAAGWDGGAPYDGIVVTAGASDLAPAWVDQLAGEGRLVLPLSIRGVQQCVAFARADGHLHSVAICECGFMSLVGAMANSDRREPVPGHPGVYVQTAADAEVDVGVVGTALDGRRTKADIGINCSVREVFGSLRRWLAFHEPTSASLTYIGPPALADASGVPGVLDFPGGGLAQRSSPCIIGPAGLAVLDLATSPAPVEDSVLDTILDLAVSGYGEAQLEMNKLRESVTAWYTAARPGADRLRIDAYPYDALPPEVQGSVHFALHTSFVVSSA
jgi:protein-L-isoaspartate(D-aspartate) O-methyltransferase